MEIKHIHELPLNHNSYLRCAGSHIAISAQPYPLRQATVHRLHLTAESKHVGTGGRPISATVAEPKLHIRNHVAAPCHPRSRQPAADQVHRRNLSGSSHRPPEKALHKFALAMPSGYRGCTNSATSPCHLRRSFESEDEPLHIVALAMPGSHHCCTNSAATSACHSCRFFESVDGFPCSTLFTTRFPSWWLQRP